MVLGVVGKKLGMTQIFNDDGLVVPVTVIKVDPLTVTHIKVQETDGYDALQVGAFSCRKKHLTKPELKHLEKNNIQAFRVLKEFRIDNPNDYKIGQKIDLSVLADIDKVDVSGKSIGKGFAGCIKRHNAHRGPMSHGSKSHRITGSIGAGTTPSKVVKGKAMPGRMGGEKVTVRKLKVVKIDNEKNLLFVKGSVPGHEGTLLTVKPSIIKWNE